MDKLAVAPVLQAALRALRAPARVPVRPLREPTLIPVSGLRPGLHVSPSPPSASSRRRRRSTPYRRKSRL